MKMITIKNMFITIFFSLNLMASINFFSDNTFLQLIFSVTRIFSIGHKLYYCACGLLLKEHFKS